MIAPEHDDLACKIDWESSCEACRRACWPENFTAKEAPRHQPETVDEPGTDRPEVDPFKDEYAL